MQNLQEEQVRTIPDSNKGIGNGQDEESDMKIPTENNNPSSSIAEDENIGLFDVSTHNYGINSDGHKSHGVSKFISDGEVGIF